jgi:hypothetical protein
VQDARGESQLTWCLEYVCIAKLRDQRGLDLIKRNGSRIVRYLPVPVLGFVWESQWILRPRITHPFLPFSTPFSRVVCKSLEPTPCGTAINERSLGIVRTVGVSRTCHSVFSKQVKSLCVTIRKVRSGYEVFVL